MTRFFPFVLWVSAALGQTIPGHYIVEFDSEPAVAVATASGTRFAPGDARITARRAQIRAEHLQAEAAIRTQGGSVSRHYDTVLNGMAVQLSDQAAAQLRARPGIRGVYPEKMWHRSLDQAVRVHRVTDTWAGLPGGQPSAGAGMKIAILDSGIDVSHPGFQGFATAVPDGYPLLSSKAEQANVNNKIIVSRDYTGEGGLDTDGHGTGLAMIAAGLTNGAAIDYLLADNVTTLTIPLQPITGVAPGAWLGNYKVCDSTGGCPTSWFLSALQDAVNDGMNVINHSAGGPIVDLSLDSGPEARAIRNTLAAGVPVVVSAGNDGQALSTIEDPAAAPDAIAVGAIGNSRLFDFAVSYAGSTPLEAVLPDISGDSNTPNLFDPVTAAMTDVSKIDGDGYACNTLPAGSLSGRIALIQRSAVGSATACGFNLKLNNAAAAGAVAAVVYNSVPNGIVYMQLTDATLPAMFLSQTDGQSLKAQISTTPDANAVMDFSGFTPFPISSDLIAAYSSAGPTPLGNIKPDLLAVGGYGAGSGDEVITATATANDAPHPYTIEAGTSFSAPFVTGSLAVLMAARPGLSGAQYKSLIINSTPAMTLVNTNAPATPMLAGTGKLDLLGAMQNDLTVAPVAVNFQTASGQVNSTQAIVVTNVGSAADTFNVVVNAIDGSISPSVDTASFSLAAGASQTINVNLTGSNLQAGAYDGYLAITGTQTSIVTRVAYWLGVPGASVQSVSILNLNELDGGGSPLSSTTIYVRFIDQAGLPVSGSPPSVTALAARSRVLKISPVGDVPGTFGIDVQLGRSRNTLDEFDVAVGTITVPVNIPVF